MNLLYYVLVGLALPFVSSSLAWQMLKALFRVFFT
jgi:hypothetical protein